jgi:biotin carboxyl carrier protein
MGPDLSDDDLLLKLLIPGKPVKRPEAKKPSAPPAAKVKVAATASADFPTEFAVDVDGEVFNVRISPKWDGAGGAVGNVEAEKAEGPKKPKELPPGALLCGMAGLVLSIEAKVGASIREGDLVAIIEAMKMKACVTPNGWPKFVSGNDLRRRLNWWNNDQRFALANRGEMAVRVRPAGRELLPLPPTLKRTRSLVCQVRREAYCLGPARRANIKHQSD